MRERAKSAAALLDMFELPMRAHVLALGVAKDDQEKAVDWLVEHGDRLKVSR